MMKNSLNNLRFFRLLRIGWKKYYALLFFLLLLAVGVWATKIEPNLLHTVHYEVQLPADAAPDFDGYTIVLLSDFHLNANSASMLERVVKKTNTLHPDVILLGGDFFVNNTPPDDAVKALLLQYFSQLSARDGVYAILGNHDYQIEEATQLLESANIKVLNNETATLHGAQGSEINLIGVEEYKGVEILRPEVLASKVRPGVPNILLAHDPNFVDYVPETVFLTLAGHTHGGQLRLPWLGTLLNSTRNAPEEMRGVSQHGATTLLVTSGIGNGNGFALRLCCMPEVVCIKLRR